MRLKEGTESSDPYDRCTFLWVLERRALLRAARWKRGVLAVH